MGEQSTPVTDREHSLLAGIQQGLSHLRGVGSLSRLLEKAAQELGQTVGFDRVIISRVIDSYLVAECIWFRDHAEDAKTLLDAWQSSPPELTHLLLETELVRRRSAALVTDPVNDPRTYKPLMQATDTKSYVAAPIAPEGRVIGFVHADQYYEGTAVDLLDRDALWTFAEGLGYAIERTVLTERLRAQRDRVRQMVVSVEALTSELFAADVDMVEGGQETREIGHAAVSMVIAPESRIRSLLTPRELEVLGLMAEGSTNRDIANRLVISEGTVKSHVKHILRKLRAANRAEAVSRFMRLSQASPA